MAVRSVAAPAARRRISRRVLVENLQGWLFAGPWVLGLVFLFIGSAQSGLLVIANAAPMLNRTASTLAFFAANAWLLSSLAYSTRPPPTSSTIFPTSPFPDPLSLTTISITPCPRW